MNHFLAVSTLVAAVISPSIDAQPSPSKLATRSQQWRCDADQKWGCELPGGCERQEASKVWVLLDFARSKYQRCDRAGCDTYTMKISEKGMFTYIQLPDHVDTFMKIGLADMYVEVAALGVSALNSFGTCKPQR